MIVIKTLKPVAHGGVFSFQKWMYVRVIIMRVLEKYGKKGVQKEGDKRQIYWYKCLKSKEAQYYSEGLKGWTDISPPPENYNTFFTCDRNIREKI